MKIGLRLFCIAGVSSLALTVSPLMADSSQASGLLAPDSLTSDSLVKADAALYLAMGSKSREEGATRGGGDKQGDTSAGSGNSTRGGGDTQSGGTSEGTGGGGTGGGTSRGSGDTQNGSSSGSGSSRSGSGY
ncbi:MAG: hypothetical protein K8I29_00565 [Alphaproteobacteria bacterium]|uniref:Uncharacterized protein n=1 Tax=Candidatus Nitrobium versatile TaxID=2884831 RepID=A0A953J1T0_9BACT|nr:hypothetical protein [Candidatus Nitrobium versatile]